MKAAIVCALLAMTAAPAVAQDKAAARGQKVFVDRKCGICHLVGDIGNKKTPVLLDGVGAKLSPADIREWITNAPEMAAKAKIDRKPPMKAYTDLSKEDLDGLVAFLSSLKK